MNWLRRVIERVCSSIGAVEKDGCIRFQNYSISVVRDDELYSVKVVDLVSIKPPQITGPIFHDEVEDTLSTTISSL